MIEMIPVIIITWYCTISVLEWYDNNAQVSYTSNYNTHNKLFKTCPQGRYFIEQGVYGHISSCLVSRYYAMNFNLKEHRNNICKDAIKNYDDQTCYVINNDFSEFNNNTYTIANILTLVNIIESDLLDFFLSEEYMINLHNLLFSKCIMMSNNYYEIVYNISQRKKSYI